MLSTSELGIRDRRKNEISRCADENQKKLSHACFKPALAKKVQAGCVEKLLLICGTSVRTKLTKIRRNQKFIRMKTGTWTVLFLIKEEKAFQ